MAIEATGGGSQTSPPLVDAGSPCREPPRHHRRRHDRQCRAPHASTGARCFRRRDAMDRRRLRPRLRWAPADLGRPRRSFRPSALSPARPGTLRAFERGGAFAGSTTAHRGPSIDGSRGAMVMPSTLSIIIDVFPREERIKAIGMWAGSRTSASRSVPCWVDGCSAISFGSVVSRERAPRFGGRRREPVRRPGEPPPRTAGARLARDALIRHGVDCPSLFDHRSPSLGLLHPNVLGAFLLALLTGGLYVAHQRRSRSPMLISEASSVPTRVGLRPSWARRLRSQALHSI